MDLDASTVATIGSGATVAGVTGIATFFIRQYAGLITPWKEAAKEAEERADRAEARAELWRTRALECEEEQHERGRVHQSD